MLWIADGTVGLCKRIQDPGLLATFYPRKSCLVVKERLQQLDNDRIRTQGMMELIGKMLIIESKGSIELFSSYIMMIAFNEWRERFNAVERNDATDNQSRTKDSDLLSFFRVFCRKIKCTCRLKV